MNLPLFRLHLGVALLAATPLFAQGLHHLSPALMTWVRCLFAAILLMLISKAWKAPFWRMAKQPWVWALAPLMTLHWITYFTAIQKAGVALGVLAFFSYPLWTAWIEPLLEKQRPPLRESLFCLIALLGLAIALPWDQKHGEAWIGVGVGIFSGLCFMGRNLIIRHRLKEEPAIPLMAWQCLEVFLLLGAFEMPSALHLNLRECMLLALLGLVFTAGAHTLFARSLRDFPARTASQIAALQPIYAPIYAGIAFGVWPSLTFWLGATLVLGVVLAESMLQWSKVRTSNS